MALPPKFAGQRFIPSEGAGASSFPSQPLHTVEIFLDYVCPFSASKFHHPIPNLPSTDDTLVQATIITNPC